LKRACHSCGRIVPSSHQYCDSCRPIPRPRGSKGVELRHAIAKRDGYRCTAILEDGSRCPETTDLQVDHIVDLAHKGSNDPANLRTLCRKHHLEKEP
jgi:5-methylcytosine-specific restriction endonuclease McrA